MSRLLKTAIGMLIFDAMLIIALMIAVGVLKAKGREEAHESNTGLIWFIGHPDNPSLKLYRVTDPAHGCMVYIAQSAAGLSASVTGSCHIWASPPDF